MFPICLGHEEGHLLLIIQSLHLTCVSLEKEVIDGKLFLSNKLNIVNIFDLLCQLCPVFWGNT